MSKVRHYCLTFYTEPKHKLPNGTRYAIYGKETCPTTGKTHWQTYIELHNPQRLSWIKKAYEDKTIHAEPRRGTREQAREYCKKDNNYTEYGRWIKGQGHRTDLEEIADQLVSGTMTIEEVMKETPKTYCQYRNGLKDLAALGTKKKTKKFRQIETIVLSGSTGKGKTRKAMKEAQYKIEGNNLSWWQDYCGEECILIDEYNNDIQITELLNLLDGYQLRLNVKGSHTYANWTKVYITTNLKREELHANAKPAHRDALFRRINTWVNMWDEEVQG